MKQYISIITLCIFLLTCTGCTLEQRENAAHARQELEELKWNIAEKNDEITRLEKHIEELELSLECRDEEYALLEKKLDAMETEKEAWREKYYDNSDDGQHFFFSMYSCIVLSGESEYHTYECVADRITYGKTPNFNIYTIYAAKQYGYTPHTCLD